MHISTAGKHLGIYYNQTLFSLEKRSDQGFMGTVVNRVVPTLHVWSIEIMLTVPLI